MSCRAICRSIFDARGIMQASQRSRIDAMTTRTRPTELRQRRVRPAHQRPGDLCHHPLGQRDRHACRQVFPWSAAHRHLRCIASPAGSGGRAGRCGYPVRAGASRHPVGRMGLVPDIHRQDHVFRARVPGRGIRGAVNERVTRSKRACLPWEGTHTSRGADIERDGTWITRVGGISGARGWIRKQVGKEPGQEGGKFGVRGQQATA